MLRPEDGILDRWNAQYNMLSVLYYRTRYGCPDSAE